MEWIGAWNGSAHGVDRRMEWIGAWSGSAHGFGRRMDSVGATNATGVQLHSPGSRSAPWVRHTNPQRTPTGSHSPASDSNLEQRVWRGTWRRERSVQVSRRWTSGLGLTSRLIDIIILALVLDFKLRKHVQISEYRFALLDQFSSRPRDDEHPGRTNSREWAPGRATLLRSQIRVPWTNGKLNLLVPQEQIHTRSICSSVIMEGR